MVTIRCDGCGVELQKGALRYCVKMDVRAAYDEMEIGLADLVRNYRAELLEAIEQLERKDPREIEETVYKAFQFDLCPRCQRIFIEAPLRFRPHGEASEPGFDVEAFLKSLGFEGPKDEEEDPEQD
jgi:hypothetical protein